jgi:UPF0271 protein
MMQADSESHKHLQQAQGMGLDLWFEAFADRRYCDDGSLLARHHAGALLNADEMLAQVRQLCQQGTVTTANGRSLALQADTLCIHGDNSEALATISALRQLIDDSSP